MRELFKRAWASEFLKGGATFTIASFLSSVLNYFFNLLAARGLGPAGFGEVTTFLSYAVIFSIPMQIMSFVAIQKIGEKQEKELSFAASMIRWFMSRLTRWWFVVIPAVLIMPFISRITNLSPVAGFVLIPFIALTFLGAFCGALLQGLRFFVWLSVIGILTIFFKLFGAILVIGGIDGLTTILIFLILSSAFSFVSSYIVLRSTLKKKAPSHMPIEKRIIDILKQKQVIITALSIVGITIFSNIDIIYAKKFFSPTDAGIYSSWNLFAKIILYVTGPISAVSYIFFSQKSSEKSHEKVFGISLLILLGTALISLIGYTYLSSFLIYILFGEKFIKVAPYLAQASIFGSLYTGITFINSYFLAKKNASALLLLMFIPLYLIALFIIPHSLGPLVSLNVLFSVLTFALYFIAYLRTISYNRTDGKARI